MATSVSYAQFEGRLGEIKALLMRHHAGDLRFIETGTQKWLSSQAISSSRPLLS